jgi:hypothetical protein
MINTLKEIEDNYLLIKHLKVSLVEIEKMDIYQKNNLIEEVKNNLKK